MEESKYMNGLETNWLQISCQRDATGDNFARGVQDFNFSVGGNFAFRPDKTYFRFALKLVKKQIGGAPGEQPLIVSNMAFADSVVDCLYDNIYFRAGGSDVSSIVNFSPHAGILKRRMNDSGAWLRSVGKDAYGLDSSYQSRLNDIASNGTSGDLPQTKSVVAQDSAITIAITTGGVATASAVTTWVGGDVGSKITIAGTEYTIMRRTSDTVIDVSPIPIVAVAGALARKAFITIPNSAKSNQRNDKYVMWKPPIGIMDSGALFSGDYRFQLNPSAQFAKRAVESLADLPNADDYTFSVEDVQLFVCIERMNAPSTGIRKLYLDEIQIQSKTLSGGANSNNLDFSVPPSTKKIVIFVQSSAAGANNIVPITKFKCLDDSDEDLRQVQITYANVSKPSTNWTSSNATPQNYMTQRYLDTQIQTDMINSEGGTERFSEWLNDRGPIMVFDYERDASDRSTHVQLSIQYGNIEANTNVFIAAIYSRVAEITTTNGFISSVQTLSV